MNWGNSNSRVPFSQDPLNLESWHLYPYHPSMLPPYIRYFVPLALACTLCTARAVVVSEEYSYNAEVSQNEACRRAEERAKSKAIASVLGEVVSSEEQMLCRSASGKTDDTCEFNQMSWSIIEGEIRGDVKVIKRVEAEKRGDKAWACVLTLDVDVVVPTRKPDPNFQLKSEIYFLTPNPRRATLQRERVPRKSFHVDDDILFEVTSTEPAHLALFGWLPNEDNKVYRIDSPATRPNCPQGAFSAPDKGKTAESYCLTASWSNAYKDTKKTYDEWLILVATKSPQKWLPAYELDQFKAILREIPLDQRRVVRRPYQLMK